VERHADDTREIEREREDRHRVQFIFLRCYLKRSINAELLKAEYERRRRQTSGKSHALSDAMWDGYRNVLDDAERCFYELTQRGQLLFAFHGTTLPAARN
jgi:hypothetical protein